MARQLFYDRLLADYAARPRTILESTHLIGEAAGLMERVVAIGRGHIVLGPPPTMRGTATSVSGPAIAVAEFTAGRTVWNRRRIAGELIHEPVRRVGDGPGGEFQRDAYGRQRLVGRRPRASLMSEDSGSGPAEAAGRCGPGTCG